MPNANIKNSIESKKAAELLIAEAQPKYLILMLNK